MKPLGDRVLCREVEVEETFPGQRIILLDGSLKSITQCQAEVVEVGPGTTDDEGDFVPMDPRLKPGVWILHEAWRRTDSGEDGLFFLKAEHVVAILEVE